jgi:hypothetical protein
MKKLIELIEITTIDGEKHLVHHLVVGPPFISLIAQLEKNGQNWFTYQEKETKADARIRIQNITSIKTVGVKE